MDPTQTDLAADVLRAIETSDYKYVASVALAVSAYFLRGPVAKRLPFFGTDPGGVALVFVLGIAGALANALFARVPLTSALVDPVLGTTVVKVVGGAIAQYVVVKKLFGSRAGAEEGSDSSGAAKVGMDAALAVEKKPDAVVEPAAVVNDVPQVEPEVKS